MAEYEYSKPKNLKVGDIVQIKHGLKEDTFYDNIIYRKEYDKYVGKIYEIEEIIKWSSPYNVAIKLKGIEPESEYEKYYFSEGMLNLIKRSESMKFKVGDKVRVKKNLITGESYGGVHFRSTMCKYLGLETSIARVVSEGNYYLEGCGSWNFSDDMLKPIENKEDKEKTNLAKALELLNMTEEEMLKEYAKTKEDKLVDEMIEKFDKFCDKYGIAECHTDCKYKSRKHCEMRFVMDFLREKGLLKEDK